MNRDELLKQNDLIPEKMLEYGFAKVGNDYIIKKFLNQDLYVGLKINQSIFEIQIYETATNEKYLPFYIKDSIGDYVSNVKETVEHLVEDVIQNCFTSCEIKERIFLYTMKKYCSVPEKTWKKYPYFTLKTKKKKKWYGIIMEIPFSKLSEKENGTVMIMNLKNDPNKIQQMIDYKTIFPAYHMNKKYWFSILLDNKIDFEKLKKRIDESYSSIENN